jgi:CHAT domain-containing protein
VDSFLLAGDGSRITLEQFKNDGYQIEGLELVTLSACNTAPDIEETDTAMDKSDEGSEVEGLGSLMQILGADAVLASLWEVDDCSTELFMKTFYRQRENARLTKAESIRQAQLGFIQGDLSSRMCRTDGKQINSRVGTSSRFKHPYYWAPFILMGNFQ